MRQHFSHLNKTQLYRRSEMSTSMYSIHDKLCAAFDLDPSDNPIPNSLFDELPDDLVRFNPELAREEALIRNSTKLKCTNCGTIGQSVNMRRWHFERCRTNLKNCKQCGDVIPRQGIKDYLYDKKTYCNRSCYTESKKGKSPIQMTNEVKQKISDYWKSYRELRNSQNTTLQ